MAETRSCQALAASGADGFCSQINLNSQFARITETIKAKNTGSKSIDRVTLCQVVEDNAVLAFQKVWRGQHIVA